MSVRLDGTVRVLLSQQWTRALGYSRRPRSDLRRRLDQKAREGNCVSCLLRVHGAAPILDKCDSLDSARNLTAPQRGDAGQ
jgi:hypothetical protein